jgi:O-antigen/teichoic acid export membrane protein
MQSTLRPTLQLMGGRIIGFAATFLIPMILVRTFALEEMGTYRQLFLIFGTLYGIAQFGMAESLYYFLPGQPKAGARLGANSTLILMFFGALCFGGLTWQADRIATWMKNSALEPLLPWLGGYLALTLVGATIEIAMISRNRHGVAAITFGLSDIARAILLVIPAVVTRDLRWLLVGGIAFATLRLVVGGLFASKEFEGKFVPDRSLLTRQLAYALPFQLAVLVEVIQLNYHQYAVAYSFDVATFAIYTMGCLHVPASELLAAPAANVMMVRMTEEIRDGRRENVLAVWDDTTRKLLLMMVPLTGFLIVAAHDLIVFLYTETYAASAVIFTLWAAMTVSHAFPTDSVLRVFADTRGILILNIIRLVVVASLIGFAISRFGLIGPVLVSLLAMVLSKGFALVRVCRLMSVKARYIIDWKTAGLSLAVTVLSCLVAVGVRTRFDVSPFLGLSVTGSVYGVCCIAMLGAWWLLKSRAIKTCAELPESSV